LKNTAPKFGADLLKNHCANFWRMPQSPFKNHLTLFVHDMDFQNVFLQQTRVAAFVPNSLSIATNLASRIKSPYQQHLLWANFVKNYKDKPLFHFHLQMNYESFCTLLEQIREYVEVDDNMASLRGGKISPEI
jgi:hypothetical protein